jgi:hypothetical protein
MSVVDESDCFSEKGIEIFLETKFHLDTNPFWSSLNSSPQPSTADLVKISSIILNGYFLQLFKLKIQCPALNCIKG